MYWLRTRSGALYGAEGQSRVVVEPIHLDVDISPLLRVAVERENSFDIDEAAPSACEDGYVATPLDDVDVLPDVAHYHPPSTPSLDFTPTDPQRNRGKKRRKRAAKERQFWADGEASLQAKSTVHGLAEPPLVVDLDVSQLPSKRGAYGAKTQLFKNRGAVHDAESLEALGLRRVEWGGINPRPVVDKNGTFAMCLIGRPDRQDYMVDCSNVLDVMQDVGRRATFKSSQMRHKRGTFPAVNAGFVAGQGQTKPTAMDSGKAAPIVEELLANTSVQRIMAFQSGALRVWAPKLYDYVKNVVATVCSVLGFTMNFPRSIFPCVAFNLGRNVWTHAHQDVMNLAFNWCFITAFGTHDPKERGFLIIWELGIYVEFPHGATIALPSATLTHSNTPVAEGEIRTSITQYVPGGVARWVDAGCSTEKQLKIDNRKAFDELQGKKAGRWRWGLGLLPTLSDLGDGVL